MGNVVVFTCCTGPAFTGACLCVHVRERTLIMAEVIVSSFSPPAGMRMPLVSFPSPALQLCTH